jgi:hypothetical protein
VLTAAAAEKNNDIHHANTTAPESTGPLLPTPQRQWTTCSMGSHGKTKGSSRASLVRWGAPGEPTRGSNNWRRLIGRHERRPQRHPTQVPLGEGPKGPGRARSGEAEAGSEPRRPGADSHRR